MQARAFTLFLAIVHIVPHFSSSQKSLNCASGHSAIVHLFEWRWDDIALECERFLGPFGFCGVQISPPNEHMIITNPMRPWYERYQPVSYKLESRSGNEDSFRDMVTRCNKKGVRIYADVVFNHMSGGGGSGTGGSHYDAGRRSFPAVPYSGWDFHGKADCPSKSGGIESYDDIFQVRNCDLLGMPDLKTGKTYVRDRVADFLNHLIDIGVAGFRIDAAKHMWPADIKAIVGRLHNLRADVFGSAPHARPFVFQEVIDLGYEPIASSEYIGGGRVTEFRFSRDLCAAFRGQMRLASLRSMGTAWGFLAGDSALVFVDNHDNQRGHGSGGQDILTYRDAKRYKAATAFTLAFHYGEVKVMSSYAWEQRWENGMDVNDWVGPPSNEPGNTKRVVINPDMTCGGGWVCEHRWRQIYNMVGFRAEVGTAWMAHWWDNGAHQAAFGREGRGFIAFNLEIEAGLPLREWLTTGLPAGVYCDVASGSLLNGRVCTGKTVTVQADSRALIEIAPDNEDYFVAIHIGARKN